MTEDPYALITKENFVQIKETLEWGISAQKTPLEISRIISERTDLTEVQARALVQDELIGAMGYLKDGDKTSR